ncbi:MAG: outer membrane protein assembly factor BamA [Desulfobacterales bacterium]
MKRIAAAVVLLLGIWTPPGLALDKVGVIVLPFAVYAPPEQAYLASEIPTVISTQLEADGANVIRPDTLPETLSQTDQRQTGTIRDFALQQTGDFVLWGSLTWIGDNYSLDARLLETFGETTPQVIFLEGQGVAGLPATVKALSGEVGNRIFKRATVSEVKITGNQRIESDAIRSKITTAPGDVYLAKSLSQDLKQIYAMGYFEDIRIEAEDTPRGKVIIFQLKEKPTVRNITIRGNNVYDDEEIKAALDIKTGSILNVYQIQTNMQRIEALYKEKNYHNVEVSYDIAPLDNNQGDLEFSIKEGDKIQIVAVNFEGNSAYETKELKKLIKTREKGFFSWLTSSGELNTDDLTQDAAQLTAFYHNNGYIQARVGEPLIDYREDGIYITIKIDEGTRFAVGEVKVEGDLVLPEEELTGRLKIGAEEYFNREIVRNDVLLLTDLYSDEGYAYARITPRVAQDPEARKVNITYSITKGEPVYFEQIIITGNTKTRDKVIRRELEIYEQELYSGKRLKEGIRKLNRLDYFEDVKVDTIKGSAEDQMVVKIDVTEKPTGTFSFGGGYSSVENLFFMASIQQRNLFGRGQILNLKAEIGAVTNRYTLSFTEPWLFDIPLSFGVDIYKWDREYTTYDKDSTGGGLRFGYPLWNDLRGYLSYNYENATVTNIDEDAAESIKELSGTNVTSSVTAALRYDTRDQIFNPTRGQNHRISVEYAGFGGDIAFTKYLAELGIYFPILWKLVGFLHGETGYVEENSGGFLPDYEKFYLGGINSMRGFDYEDIFALDDEGKTVGGEKYVLFNAELTMPLISEAGLMGVAFYDTGNVYRQDEDIDFGELRESAGLGIRWYSPMGPLRLEYGWVLDREEGEDAGQWEFSVGAPW